MLKAPGHTAYEVAGTNQGWLTVFPLDQAASCRHTGWREGKGSGGPWAVCEAHRDGPRRIIFLVILQAWSTDLQGS